MSSSQIRREGRTVVAGLYDEHAERIFRYACRRVGVDDAADVLSATFAHALESFESFDVERGLEVGWLFGITNNVIRHHWRSERRRLRRLGAIGPTIDHSDPFGHVDERLAAAAQIGPVIDALLKLSADDRDLVLLVAWQDLTYAEIAVAIGVPIGTVRSRLHRIRSRLTALASQGASA